MIDKLTLRQARLIRGKTQIEVAKVLNIHPQTYRKLEANPQKITVEQAQRICFFLDFSYDEIFFQRNICIK